MAADEYSARQIAEAIKRPDELLSAAMNRLNNWTNEGFVKPIGELRPGTGRSRTYSYDARMHALLIQALVDGAGMPAVTASKMIRSPAWEGKELLASVTAGASATHVLIWRDYNSTDFTADWMTRADAAKFIRSSDAEVHILLDMSKFFPRLKGKK